MAQKSTINCYQRLDVYPDIKTYNLSGDCNADTLVHHRIRGGILVITGAGIIIMYN